MNIWSVPVLCISLAVSTMLKSRGKQWESTFKFLWDGNSLTSLNSLLLQILSQETVKKFWGPQTWPTISTYNAYYFVGKSLFSKDQWFTNIWWHYICQYSWLSSWISTIWTFIISFQQPAGSQQWQCLHHSQQTIMDYHHTTRIQCNFYNFVWNYHHDFFNASALAHFSEISLTMMSSSITWHSW